MADVQAYIDNSELSAALTIALASGQAAAIGVIIPDVTMEVRGYVRVRNTLGPAGTVPQELKTAAIDIMIYRIANRLRKNAIAKDKKTDYDASVEKLDKVAAGDFKVSAPVTATTDVTSAPGPSFEVPHHRFGWDKERGV